MLGDKAKGFTSGLDAIGRLRLHGCTFLWLEVARRRGPESSGTRQQRTRRPSAASTRQDLRQPVGSYWLAIPARWTMEPCARSRSLLVGRDTEASGPIPSPRPFVTPHTVTPDGRERPAETLIGTAVGRRLLARRKPGVQIRRLGIWPSRSHSCTALPGRFRVEGEWEDCWSSFPLL